MRTKECGPVCRAAVRLDGPQRSGMRPHKHWQQESILHGLCAAKIQALVNKGRRRDDLAKMEA